MKKAQRIEQLTDIAEDTVVFIVFLGSLAFCCLAVAEFISLLWR